MPGPAAASLSSTIFASNATSVERFVTSLCNDVSNASYNALAATTAASSVNVNASTSGSASIASIASVTLASTPGVSMSQAASVKTNVNTNKKTKSFFINSS